MVSTAISISTGFFVCLFVCFFFVQLAIHGNMCPEFEAVGSRGSVFCWPELSPSAHALDQCDLPLTSIILFFFDSSDDMWILGILHRVETWSLNKQMTNKLRTAQRAMERKMLDLKLKDKIPCAEIRKRTKIIDIIEYTLKQKWKWAGHIARLKDNRWTRRCTEWQPRRGKRSRGRPSRRWQDDITEKEGTTWIRKATDRRRWKTLMEGYILQWMDKA